MPHNDLKVDGITLTPSGRVGFYLDKKGNLRELPADYDGQTPPEDAALGGVYRVVKMDESESRLLALQIEQIKDVLRLIDWDYFATAQHDFGRFASNYDATAVLNRNYTPQKGDLLAAQANAMRLILQLRAALLECDDLRAKSQQATETLERISLALGG